MSIIPPATTGPAVERTKPHAARLPSFPVTEYQVIAAILWLAGCATTWFMLRALGVPPWSALALALPFQWICTKLEAPIWRRKINVISVLFLGFDALVNAGGVFALVQRVDRVPFWSMLHSAGIVGATIDPISATGVALFLGFALAAAPETVWRWRA
ncbi:MAG: hypothetical protein CYG59_16450 [Chloroflexi bacterium]|nr:MAG: hypothetical protein CYG59_16450 [Chloroflexota bacterium]